MGAGIVSEQNQHIKIDSLTPFMTECQQRKLIRPLLFISGIICAFFCWYSGIFWMEEWQYAPENERWGVYMALILPAGFFMLSLHLLLLSITHYEEDLIAQHKIEDCHCDHLVE